jgi:DNA (cytosine-5)-methyltransferase 1
MRTYYNDNDPKCVEWLRYLRRAGLISLGKIDGQSICDIKDTTLVDYGRVHLFAGIGGWDYALRLAGWPIERPIWTASCPCQPFSSAGKHKGYADSRDLWPEVTRLIKECHPDTIFGEQVPAAIGHGWLDRVCADLEAEGYAVGAVVLGAHSVGAPHIRQRLYWVANLQRTKQSRTKSEERRFVRCSDAGRIPDSGSQGLPGRQEQPTRQERQTPERGGDAGGVDDANSSGTRYGDGRQTEPGGDRNNGVSWPTSSWSESTAILCRDGKSRRIPLEPAFFPLAHGLPGRVAQLRGLGNAIVPQAAAVFIKAFLESE